MSLEKITEEMRSRVGAHSPIQKVIKFDFGDDGIVRIDGVSSPTVIDNDDTDADCTVKVSMENFIQIAEGNLNAQMAFMTGKLRVEGDMSIAMQLGSILG
ncbi:MULTISPECIES: SCP2 sterol-binding domain-containing protein [Kordiimonas]|uniref:SCP2 sterol-binding domain-containing protein n=1 Tax=Kordiimonas TaxID=288021 RepID=UPI001FF2FA73|nr:MULTISPECIES: SCP2 sterol-binding domain-containing protein [Kordiimonas]MCK0069104.1 SCP2 sterol-binding domain-containing protein [Kordiimonas laminariae]UTW58440.1 SCP2 sterol-binding domain-containing protein [Kordiimonas sp. SCSIO 12603]